MSASKRTMLRISVLILFLLQAMTAQSAPQVVASIVPIHSLLAALMQGIGEPKLLLHGNVSPHDYALRPSDMHTLSSATVVFWVGPALEAGLSKPLRNLTEVRVETLLETPDLKLLPLREGGLWERDDHNHNHAPETAENLTYDNVNSVNPHIWLDPDNAQAMLKHMASVLSEIDPANSELYQHNQRTYQDRLSKLSTQLEQKLTAVSTQPYIVFHDAYPYFEQRFGLQAIGSITLNPERTPGAKRVRQIRARIVDHEVRCVFSEPQFQPALVQTLIADTASRAGVLDPLGMSLKPGPEAYLQLLEGLTDSLLDCLK